MDSESPEGFCAACMLEGALGSGQPEFPIEPPGFTMQLGEYQLLEEIARGGMGVVFRARQVRLNRIVAVKLILAGRFADHSAVRRFQGEAEAAAKLRHPNVVAIYEIGEAGGQHFFSMEYVAGQDLAGFLRQNPLSIRQCVHFMIKIAKAVAYAHEQGIVHRDLKPSNILVDRAIEPRITDFGLARDLHADADLTVTGQVLGSPNYISPEQAAGKPAGKESDIYSLGAILYHLLTGRPPFAAETLTDTLQLVTVADPVPPRSLNPSVPRDLETICLKCLEKGPEKRYANAGDLAADLSRFVDDLPIQARPISAPAKAWRWCRRQPVVAALTAAFMLSLLFGFAGVTWQWRRAEQRAEENRYHAYLADMRRAQSELEAENTSHGREILRKYLPRPGEKDLRNWEWHYAWNKAQTDELFSFKAYDLAVLSIALSANGSRLAIAGGGPVILWDMEQRQEITRLKFSNNVYAVDFSPDESRLFVGTGDGRLIIWNFQAGQPDRVITNRPFARSLRASPNGKHLAVYYHDGLELLDLGNYEQLATFPLTAGNDNLPAGIAFSPDSSLLAYCREGGEIVLWDIEHMKEIAILNGHKANVTGLVFSPDAETLISASRDGTVRVWDWRSSTEIERLMVSSSFLCAVVLSPDGKTLAVAGARQQVRLFETGSWRQIRSLTGHEAHIQGLAFRRNGELISGAADGCVKVWLAAPDAHRSMHTFTEEIAFAELLEGGRGMQVSYTNGTHAWWNTDPLEKTSAKSLSDQEPIRISPDGKLVAAATKRGVNIFDYKSDRLLESISLKYTGGRGLAFSRDARLLAIRGYEDECQIWRIHHGATPGQPSSALASIKLGSTNGAIQWVKFSPDSKHLCVIYPGLVEIWTLATQRRVRLETNWNQVDVAVSRDGLTAFTTGAGGKLRVWDLRTERQIAALGGQLGTLWSVELSPDESRIAACGGDGTVRIWDRKTLQEVAILKIDDQPLGQLAFSENGESLFVLRLDFRGGVERRLVTLRAPKVGL